MKKKLERLNMNLKSQDTSINYKLKKNIDSIIVCDDCSSDMTSEISQNLGAQL